MTYSITNETGTARVVWEHDDLHETRGSYAYETEEETKAAEEHEIKMLENGHWAALTATVETLCPHCKEWRALDSLGGIVIEPTTEKLEEFARHSLDLPTPGKQQEVAMTQGYKPNDDPRFKLIKAPDGWLAMWADTPGLVASGPRPTHKAALEAAQAQNPLACDTCFDTGEVLEHELILDDDTGTETHMACPDCVSD